MMITSINDKHCSKRWTRKEMRILCIIWFVQCHHIGETGVIRLFREQCNKECIYTNRTDNAICSKIRDCYCIFHKLPSQCSLLFRTVFAEVIRDFCEI